MKIVARAGLMPADHVLKIGDTHAAQFDYLEAVRLLRGNPGEPLHLTIWRNTSQETREFEIIRETQRQETVRDAMLLHEKVAAPWKIGYARISITR